MNIKGAITVDTKERFLLELADLIEKYDVAVCSKEEGDYSQVFFQFHKGMHFENVFTKRLHSSPHELRLIARYLSKEPQT